MSSFTPWSALIGGSLIGIASALMLRLNGRIAGVSGIVGGLLRPARGDAAWRAAFIVGLVLGALAFSALGGNVDHIVIEADYALLVVGGLLVGFGTRLGGGCTSGHGVCGLSRLSPRAFAATALFMTSAAVTVYLVRHVVGGVS
jgi:uncharacterized protein